LAKKTAGKRKELKLKLVRSLWYNMDILPTRTCCRGKCLEHIGVEPRRHHTTKNKDGQKNGHDLTRHTTSISIDGRNCCDMQDARPIDTRVVFEKK